MYRKYLSILLLYSTLASCTTPESIHNNFDSLFQHCYDNDLFNGHVLIYKEGEIIYNSSFGNLNFNSSESITEHSAFRLASLSKQFTAMAMVHLKSKGLLKYNDKVVDFFPDFPYDQITIRHLLNHTSGLPDYQNLLNPQFSIFTKAYHERDKYVSNETICQLMNSQSSALEFEPGTNFNYSNTGYLYLAQIIEQVSGMSFGTYLNDNFFKPLNLKNSWVDDTVITTRKKAIGYQVELMSNTAIENEVPPFLKVYGDGGIYSSAQDLLTWLLALDSGKIMDAKALEEAYELPVIGEEEGPYGFGWFVRKLPFNGNKALTHSGEFAGFSNAIFRDLDANTTVIMLSNNSNKVRSAINSAVVRILYGLPFEYPKISAADVLLDIIISGDIKTAKQFYEANLENKLYDFSEKAFNRFGYDLLNANKTTLAIEIFKWNIEKHPKSSNAYDSLGEAYLMIGDKEHALEYYSLAYQMNPKNDQAKKIIDRLSHK